MLLRKVAVTESLAQRSSGPCKMRLLALLAFLLLVSFFTGCAKKDLQAEFKPIQLHWIVAEGQSEESIQDKDNCVIRLTGRLMGEQPVQASSLGELEYRVIYGKSAENPEILDFEGVCEDEKLSNLPECKWSATCDHDLNIVVKFHNGD